MSAAQEIRPANQLYGHMSWPNTVPAILPLRYPELQPAMKNNGLQGKLKLAKKTDVAIIVESQPVVYT